MASWAESLWTSWLSDTTPSSLNAKRRQDNLASFEAASVK